MCLIGHLLLFFSLLDPSADRELLSFGVGFIFIKALSFLRIIDSTRMLIKLVTEVMKDMFAFTIILIGIMFMFSVVTFTLQTTGGDTE